MVVILCSGLIDKKNHFSKRMASNAPKKSYAKKTAPEKQTMAVFRAIDGIFTLSSEDTEWSDKTIPMLPGQGYPAIAASLPGVKAIIVAKRVDLDEFVKMLDLPTMTWSDQPLMAVKRNSAAGVCLADGTTFLVCGGINNDQKLLSCEQFDSTTKTWHPVADMSGRRAMHCMVLYDGIPVALGGRDQDGLNTAEQYKLGVWSTFPSFNVSRFAFGAAVVLNKIYITGGLTDGDHALVEVYDGAAWSILCVQPFVGSRWSHDAVCFQDKLVVIGDSKEIDVYDPIEDTWLKSHYPAFDFSLFCRAVVF